MKNGPSHNIKCWNFIGFLNSFAAVLVSLSCICKLIDLVELRVWINILIVIISILQIISQQFFNSTFSFSPIFNIIILFLGPYPIPYTLTLTFLLHSPSSTLKPYITYIFIHLLWWYQGNRYEYSSIDIKQSYIFSS